MLEPEAAPRARHWLREELVGDPDADFREPVEIWIVEDRARSNYIGSALRRRLRPIAVPHRSSHAGTELLAALGARGSVDLSFDD